MRALSYSVTFGMLILVLYLLNLGKSFLIPLVIGIVIWYIIMTIAQEYEKVHIKKWYLKRWLSITLALLTMIFAGMIVIELINNNIQSVVAAAPSYQVKIQQLIIQGYQMVGVAELPQLQDVLGWINVSSIISAVAGMLTTLAGYAGMILVVVLLLMMEYRTFNSKIKAMFPNQARYKKCLKIIDQINQDVKTYIKIKGLASLTTALLSYLVLASVGVDFAVFWAILIFLFNFIPTFGSIVAVSFPLLVSLIQFDNWRWVLLLAICLVSIQFLIGNVLEPKFMGKSLNLSPLVIVLSLAIWGKIWGVTGMFLCVPIMVIVNIILSKFETTRRIAVLLSANGEVD